MNYKIGNIVGLSNEINISKEKYINYVDDYDDIQNELPTLIFGWENTKKIFPRQSILDNVITENKIYWTFNYIEKSETSIKLYQEFLDNVFDYYFKKYNYTIIDPLFHEFDDLFEYVDFTEYKIYHINHYVYGLKGNDIIGINLAVLKFLGLDIRDIILKIKKMSVDFFYDKDKKKYDDISRYFNYNFLSLEKYMITLI